MSTQRQEFTQSSAWQVADLGSKEQLGMRLTARHRDALLSALEYRPDVPLEDLSPTSFPLASIEPDIAQWRRILTGGEGIALLRGLPVDELSVEQIGRIFYGLGSYFGIAVSQSNDGEKLGHVVNLGGEDRRQRAYQSARALNLHTDRCDIVGMLCIRPAMSGGLSGYASALAIHNEVLRTRPDLLEPLYTGFRLHRFGEQGDGPPLTELPVPVFSVADGEPNVVYIRGYIDLAEDEGHYTLSPPQREALDYFDEIANRPQFRLDLQLQRGDATFTNNAALVHRRDSFEDSADLAARRHLLRLWLMNPQLPAIPSVRAHKSLAGITKIEGQSIYYQGQS